MPTQSMNRRSLLASSAALTGTFCAPSLVFAQTPGGPPVAPVRPVTETYFGTTVVDPYRWMEAEAGVEDLRPGRGRLRQKARRDPRPGRPGRRRRPLHRAGGGGERRADRRRRTSSPRCAPPAPTPSSSMSARACTAPTACCWIRTSMRPQARTRRWTGGPARRTAAMWCSGPSPGGSENSTARIMADGHRRGAVRRPSTAPKNAGPSWTADGLGLLLTTGCMAGRPLDSTDKYKLSAVLVPPPEHGTCHRRQGALEGLEPGVAIADTDFPAWASRRVGHRGRRGGLRRPERARPLYASAKAAQAGAPKWSEVCVPADDVTSGAVHGKDLYLLSHKGASRYKVLKTTAASPAVARRPWRFRKPAP